MRNLIIFLALVGVFVVGRRGCHCSMPGMDLRGSGPMTTQTRSVSDFHAIDLNLAGEVELSIGDRYAVEVQAQESLLPILKTEVENGKLKIYFDKNVSYSENVKIRVTAPSFDGLDVAGSGTIRAMTAVKADKMDVDVSGSGNVYLPQGEFGALICDISGSGGIELGGTATTLKANVAGSGEIDSKSLTANALDAAISGSGTITCNVTQTLKADVAGSGEVLYLGQPTVDADVSGSGKVKRL